MIRLLIVDNESDIVDSLVEMAKEERPELEVYKAYSAMEALKELSRTKIDIVLSDIQMPGMSGLELQEHVVRQWPHCRFLFLSGYSEFSYVQKAMQQGGVEYLLKTDGDLKILTAIDRAIKELNKQFETTDLIRQAQASVLETLPLLQNDFFKELLHGNSRTYRVLPEQMKNLNLPFDAEEKVLMVMGRVDSWPQHIPASDWPLMMFAIRNIAEECLSGAVRTTSIPYDENRLVWFIQNRFSKDEEHQDEDRMMRFIMGTLESVQEICYQLLKIKISLLVEQEPADWHNIHDRFGILYRLLNRNFWMGGEMRLLQVPIDDGSPPANSAVRATGVPIYQIEQLSRNMETGKYHEFLKVMHEITEHASASNDPLTHISFYYALVPVFLNYLSNRKEQKEWESRIDIGKLTRYDLHLSWMDAVHYLMNLSETLFALQSNDHQNLEQETVRKIHAYVSHHLDEDLSLTRLGELTGYNPSYLSRFYRQTTERGLSEYISEVRLNRAKELLADNKLKMSEIAARIGFSSDHYFYRFFKKETALTPQEYRDLILHNKS